VNNNYNPNTVVKQDMAVVKQVDGRAAQLGTRSGRAPPYQIMLDPSLQEHYKTKMIQQEHHKTEYHLCEVMAGISFCKLNIHQPFYFSFI
jgi:hypothetical protein